MDSPLKHFADLCDPRVERTREYLLEEILLEPVYKLCTSQKGVGETDPDHGFRGSWTKFVVFAQSSRPSHPSEVSLHDPAFGQNLEGV